MFEHADIKGKLGSTIKNIKSMLVDNDQAKNIKFLEKSSFPPVKF